MLYMSVTGEIEHDNVQESSKTKGKIESNPEFFVSKYIFSAFLF